MARHRVTRRQKDISRLIRERRNTEKGRLRISGSKGLKHGAGQDHQGPSPRK